LLQEADVNLELIRAALSQLPGALILLVLLTLAIRHDESTQNCSHSEETLLAACEYWFEVQRTSRQARTRH